MSLQDYAGQIKVWVLVIEWGGQKPPRKWYDFLNNQVGRIRPQKGNKRGEVMSYRSETGWADGIQVQEGAIFCKSQRLARGLANFAVYECGHLLDRQPTVVIVEGTATEGIALSAHEKAIMDRVEKVRSAAGRKPASVKYAVTCTECGVVSNDEQPKNRVVSCPNCGSFDIHYREGTAVTYQDDGRDIFDLWTATRFAFSHFEPSPINDTGKKAPAVSDVNVGGKEYNTWYEISDTPDFLQIVRKIADSDRQAALDILDAVIISRTYRGEDERNEARIKAIAQYTKRKGDPQYIDFAEVKIDLWDTALMMGTQIAASLVLQYVQNAAD